MALSERLTVTNLAAHTSIVVPHTIGLPPDVVLPDRSTQIGVTASDATSVTFHNNGDVLASAVFLAYRMHSVQGQVHQGAVETPHVWAGDLTTVVAADVTKHVYPAGNTAADINASIAAIGADQKTLHLLPGTWSIDAAVVVPANAHLQVDPGAVLTKAGAGTLVVNGSFWAPAQQVFSGFSIGDILFQNGVAIDCLAQWWGAKGNGVTDDTVAIKAAIAAMDTVHLLPGASHLISSTIDLGTGQSLLSKASGRSTGLLVAHGFVGPVVTLTGQQAKLCDVDIAPALITDRKTFEGVKLTDCSRATVRAVRVWFPDIGFNLKGYTYWNVLDVDVYQYRTTGVELGDAGGQACSNNNILFRAIYGSDPNYGTRSAAWAPLTVYSLNSFCINGGKVYIVTTAGTSAAAGGPTGEGASIVDGTVAWDYCCPQECRSIWIRSGSVNEIRGGQASYGKYLVETDSGIENRLVSVWSEFNSYNIKAAAGTHTIVSSHFAENANSIAAGALVATEAQDDIAPQNNLFGERLSSKDLKCLYTFDEGSGVVVVDHSGNGHNLLTINTPPWTETGKFGPILRNDPAAGGGTQCFSGIPVAAVDWTQPFTMAILAKRASTVGNGQLVQISDFPASHYLDVRPYADHSTVVFYDGVGAYNEGLNRMHEDADGWAWHVLYFDPPNNQVTSLDPALTGAWDTPTPAHASVVWAAVSSVTIARDRTGAEGIVGGVAFTAIWQRRLTLKEVLHLVNSRSPWRLDKVRAGIKIQLAQPDGTMRTLTVDNTGALVIT